MDTFVTEEKNKLKEMDGIANMHTAHVAQPDTLLTNARVCVCVCVQAAGKTRKGRAD